MLLQRIMDVMLAFPAILLAMALVAVLEPSVTNVILAVAVVTVPTAARVIRGSTLVVKQNVYIEAARTLGANEWRILVAHILPNVTAPIIVIATVTIGNAILTEAALSFLGLGVQPPTPSWGSMLSGAGALYFERAPWMALAPGLAITMVVFAFNMLGDAMRDVLDPRLRGR
jgi:peptide/nickel transport system permease protein